METDQDFEQIEDPGESHNELEKQPLSDTILAFLPKNSSGYTTKGQIVDIQIPKTEHVIYLNKAYIQLTLNIEFKLNEAYSQPANNEKVFVGLINAATIFDQVQVKNNGKTIVSDTFSQVNSRIWQMSKSTQYLQSMNASFLNIDDISMNEGFLVKNISSFSNANNTGVEFKMRIPLGSLFQCFDNADNFSTSHLNDDITLSMQLSDPTKFMVLITTDEDGKVIRTQPFDQNGYAIYKTSGDDEYKVRMFDQELYNYRINDDLKIVVPGHYPSEKERSLLDGLIANGGWVRDFTSCDIQQQKADFGPESNLTEVTADNVWGNNQNTALNFSSNANNILAIIMLISHEHSYVNYDKPYMSNIECNLSEIWKLANEKVHTKPTYDNDNDMIKDLINGFGTDSFKNLNRLDKAIIHDYLQKDPTSANMLGSYIQWYKVACGNQLGVGADFFANMINYKFHSLWNSQVANNYANSSVFCAQLSFRRLIYVQGGIDIETPFPNQDDMRNYIKGEFVNNGHGAILAGLASTLIPTLAPMLVEPVKNLVSGVGKGIKWIWRKIRGHGNASYSYGILGKDGYSRNRELIEPVLGMKRHKFKKYINNLKESQNHGVVVRHGVSEISTIPTDGNGASTTQNVEGERPDDFDLRNYKYLMKQSLNADIADIDYKNQLVLDYKWGLNRQKLVLGSFGSETALERNNAHGLWSWLKGVGKKVIGFFKNNGGKILKSVANNAITLASQYAVDVVSGKMSIKDVPRKLRHAVQEKIQNNSLTGTPLDSKMAKALEYAKKIRNHEMDWSQVPDQVYSLVKKIQAESHSGHGVLVRYGFDSDVPIKPTVDYHITKRRIQSLMNKNPRLLRQKHLRKLYRFQYLKEHPLVENSHGNFASTLAKYLLDRPITGFSKPPSHLFKPNAYAWNLSKPPKISDAKTQNSHGFNSKFFRKIAEKNPNIVDSSGNIDASLLKDAIRRKKYKFLLKHQNDHGLDVKRAWLNKIGRDVLKEKSDFMRKLFQKSYESIIGNKSKMNVEKHGIPDPEPEDKLAIYKKRKAAWRKYKESMRLLKHQGQ